MRAQALVWEYDTPVPIKYISEPDMHSMPAVSTHPSGEFWVGQSLDNKIVTYGATGRMKLMRKRVFKGHTVTGYACVPGFSPNGKFLMSGDGEGKLVFWDFKSTKVRPPLHVPIAGVGCLHWTPTMYAARSSNLCAHLSFVRSLCPPPLPPRPPALAKRTKLYRKLHAHSNGPCMQAIWHPIEQSRVATCGWDGLIKYWD